MNRDLLEFYRLALAACGTRICEETSSFASMPELEWQARWFAGDFGREWESPGEDRILVEDFGRWNREPGPDFVDARVRIGEREFQGAIELDFDARDWEHHGHAINPAFRDTALHVFMHRPSQQFFTRTCDHREVAQLHLPATAKTSDREPPSPPFLAWDASRIEVVLHAAARHRLDLKARALFRQAAVHGEEESWFAALAVTLGYKHNQIPFLLLAQRVGRRAAAGSDGEALLFGSAGFLESPTPPEADRAVRRYLRELWEKWWSVRASCERWILSPKSWRLAGVRPANHPHRRVAALGRIATGWARTQEALATRHRDRFVAALESFDHPFWNVRFNLQASPLGKPQALLGAERIRDMVINLHYPLAVAKDDSAWNSFLAEKGPAPAAILRHTARRFFGPILEEKGALASAAVQQGLLQLERDYRASAAPAEFAAALRRLS